jgi:hypothetical protein
VSQEKIMRQENNVFPKLYAANFVALTFIAVWSTTNSASAVTVEVARKCQALIAKTYPPRVPGNPAAGRENGTAQDVRDYFNKCVTNGGNVEAPKDVGNKNNQAPTESK